MRPTIIAILILGAALAAGCREQATDAPATPAAPTAAPKPGWEYTPEDFNIGHKTTANARCNREIDKLREEIRSCFNARAPAECEGVRQANMKKIGVYIRSPRCAK
jgi:hypothetical protein